MVLDQTEARPKSSEYTEYPTLMTFHLHTFDNLRITPLLPPPPSNPRNSSSSTPVEASVEWEKFYSDSEGQFYYHNKKTGESKWEDDK